MSSLLFYLLTYLFIAFVPALVLLMRGRGWRPHFFAATFFLAWTGGGWVIMLWIACQERDGQWKMK